MSGGRGPILRKRSKQPPKAATDSESGPQQAPEDAPPPEPQEERPSPGRGGPYPKGGVAQRDRAGRREGRGPREGRPAREGLESSRRSGNAPPTRGSGAGPGDGARSSKRVTGGRRLYDPKADRGGGAVTSASMSGKDAKPGRRGAGRPLVMDEKSELKARAQKLAKEKGIPLVHAYRILKGQTTLNDVLKGMMRKERFEQLVTREGVDRELAGQVASGHLPKQRAVLLTRMRTLRKQKLHIDGIKAAEADKKKIGLDLFGKGWVLGRVRAARPYDFDFLAEGAERTDKLFKHDVKAVCTAEDFEAAQRACEIDAEVQKLGLAQTEDRSERVRPSDETMLRFIDDQRIVRFTMRDGEQILGRLRSFGRWDAELVLEGGELVTVFFHGLHTSSVHLGHPSE